MNEETSCRPSVPITNFFVYKDKKYPFNFTLFKVFSELFSNKQISQSNYIFLIDEGQCSVSLNEEYIQYFIDYCQNIPIPKEKINIDSAPTFHFLASYYQVRSLIEQMETYFNQNEESFILYFLSNSELNIINQEKYESLLSKRLLDFIERPEMLSIPVAVMHRVLSKYCTNLKNQDESQPELTEFLFKYLEKNGFKASCLFSFIDLSNEKSEYLHLLLHKHSKDFDFHFVNSSLLKSLYKIENEFIESKQVIDSKKEETLENIANEIDKFSQIKNDLVMQKNEIIEEINQLKTEIDQIKEDSKKEIINQISEFKKEIDELAKSAQDQFDKKKNIIKMKKQIKKDFINDQNDLKNEVNQITNDLRDDFNQHKSDLNESLSKSQNEFDEFKSYVQENLSKSQNEFDEFKSYIQENFSKSQNEFNEFKSNLENNILSKSKEENEKLRLQINQLKRIIYDIDSSNYFEKSDKLEAFNSLYGESQALIIEGIVNKNKNASSCIKNVDALLSFLLKEQKKSTKPIKLTSFINIQSKEKLLNMTKIDLIGINCDTINMLYENGTLNSGELADIIRRFDDFYIEIQYPSNNFDNIYNYVSNTLKRQNQKLKISVFIYGRDQTDDHFKNNHDINIITIGSTVNEIKGGLHQGSFEGSSSLEKVFISNSVTKIGGGAFSSCNNLKQITIPNSVTTIEGGSFSRCSSLTEIAIPSSVNQIDQFAFEYCTNLERLTINPYKTKFESNVFANSSNIKCLIFESSVTAINRFDYDYFWQLTEIIIPESVTSIQEGALLNCSSLKKLTISNSIRCLNINIFKGCCKTLETITFDPYSTKYESDTFGECSHLKNLIFYRSVTFTQEFNLFAITRFTKITIPNSVTYIGAKSFRNYNCLEEIIISNSVTYIEYDAFYGCTKLAEVIIPNSVKTIAGGAFCKCTSLKKVVLPDSIKSIGGGCFSLCTSLKQIKIPSSIVFIENDFCRECEKLEKVTIPNSITTIGAGAFSNCKNLKEVSIPDSVQYIQASAFLNCGLQKVQLSKSLTSIEHSVFKDCSQIEEIELPDSLNSIGHDAFAYNVKMNKLEIPSSVKIINSYAFHHWSKLSELIFKPHSSLLTICCRAFNECSSLKKITIPSSVTEICDFAFNGCSCLEKITFENPSSLDKIGIYSFCGINQLTQISIPPSVTSIGKNCFYGCTSLRNVSLPRSLKKKCRDYSIPSGASIAES